MTELFDLSGSIALVTGSGGGLGFSIARGLARAGANVVLNGRNTRKLEAAVAELTAAGLIAHGYPFDVTDTTQVADAVDAIQAEVGPVDILVNNAGLQRRGLLQELSKADWDTVINTNLSAPFVCAQAVVPGMIERRRGKIINICSVISELGRESIGNYAAAKGGLKMLTRAMATEWAKHNIQANGIGPGYFATEMTESLRNDERFDQWIRNRTPAGRWGDPEELVGPAVFLASRASDFVNGHILYVDGGLLACI